MSDLSAEERHARINFFANPCPATRQAYDRARSALVGDKPTRWRVSENARLRRLHLREWGNDTDRSEF